ncbi:Hsp20/alpha crystallin family protein [Thermodesulfobacteriota bacterium]
MTNEEARDLVAKEKQKVTGPLEQTRPGRVFTPEVDILEKEGEIVVLADLPGVRAEDLVIDLRENVLTIEGDVPAPEAEGEVDVLREYETGRYYRQFTVSSVIDQSNIQAALTDGVMTLTLPKIPKAQPRKIEVRTG